jgi:predicted transcriptional regulator YheO
MVHPSALPEGREWPDTGCELHSRCLTCPFEECQYETTYEAKREAKIADMMELTHKLYSTGLTQKEVAERLNISRRQVIRYLQGVAS